MIDGLNPTDCLILKDLLENPMNRTGHDIAFAIGKSETYVYAKIRYLRERGILKQSFTGRYFILDKLKPVVAETLMSRGMQIDLEKGEQLKRQQAEQEADDWEQQLQNSIV